MVTLTTASKRQAAVDMLRDGQGIEDVSLALRLDYRGIADAIVTLDARDLRAQSRLAWRWALGRRAGDVA